jgi:hypothetical protein
MRLAGQEMIRGCVTRILLEYLLFVHTVEMASLEVCCLMLPKTALRMETFLLFDCSSLVAIVYCQIPTERGFL